MGQGVGIVSQTRRRRAVTALWVGVALVMAAPAQAGPGVAKAVKFEMRGWLDGLGGHAPVKLKNDYWINLLTARPRGTAVPKNEVLVALLACSADPGLQLAVLDTDLSSLVGTPLPFTTRTKAPVNSKQVAGQFKTWDVSLEVLDVGATYTTTAAGVMRYGYKTVGGEFCPTKGKSRAFWVTIENGNREVYGKGKLVLGKTLIEP
jgi:hypothetical protein